MLIPFKKAGAFGALVVAALTYGCGPFERTQDGIPPLIVGRGTSAKDAGPDFGPSSPNSGIGNTNWLSNYYSRPPVSDRTNLVPLASIVYPDLAATTLLQDLLDLNGIEFEQYPSRGDIYFLVRKNDLARARVALTQRILPPAWGIRIIETPAPRSQKGNWD